MATTTTGPIRSTRFASLSYQRRDNHWRMIDRATGCGIGPFYHSEFELLANLERFAAQFGADRPKTCTKARFAVGQRVTICYATGGEVTGEIVSRHLDIDDGTYTYRVDVNPEVYASTPVEFAFEHELIAWEGA